MTEEKRKKQNQEKVVELYLSFAEKIELVLKDMEARGYRPRIQDAWRSPQDQLKAYNSGHSKLKYGFHNVTGANGKKESLAVDVLDDDFPLASRKAYLLNLADAAEKHGLKTGITWGLPAKLSTAINNAIITKNWSADVKIGWDPTHIEPININPAQAKLGQRPK
jgi:hypothetical protein